MSLSARAQMHLAEARAEVGEDPVLQAAYLAGVIVALENDGYHKRKNQSVRDMVIKGEKTIEGGE